MVIEGYNIFVFITKRYLNMLKVPYACKPRDHELDHSRRITSVRERKVVIIVLITCVASRYIQSPNFITTFKTPR